MFRTVRCTLLTSEVEIRNSVRKYVIAHRVMRLWSNVDLSIKQFVEVAIIFSRSGIVQMQRVIYNKSGRLIEIGPISPTLFRVVAIDKGLADRFEMIGIFGNA